MKKASRRMTKAMMTVLIMALVLGMLPPKLAWAQSVPDTSAHSNLYLPLIQMGQATNSLPGPESAEYQLFAAHVQALVDTLDFEVSSDGAIKIHGTLPVNAAMSTSEQDFYNNVSTVLNLMASEQLTVTLSNPAPEGEVNAAFSRGNRANSLYVQFDQTEFVILNWVLSDAVSALLGTIVTAFMGGKISIGRAVGYFFLHYIKDYLLKGGLPTYLRFSLFKNEVKDLSKPIPFYIKIGKAGAQCDNRFRRWWLVPYAHGLLRRIEHDPNCWT